MSVGCTFLIRILPDTKMLVVAVVIYEKEKIKMRTNQDGGISLGLVMIILIAVIAGIVLSQMVGGEVEQSSSQTPTPQNPPNQRPNPPTLQYCEEFKGKCMISCSGDARCFPVCEDDFALCSKTAVPQDTQ